MKKILCWFVAFLAWVSVSSAWASLIIPMYIVGSEKKVGYVLADDTIYGLLLSPHLRGLPPGSHGFHIHEGGSCADFGCAAGGHFDPMRTCAHLGPYRGDGHLGDLPVLPVSGRGIAVLPVLAPRLKLADIKGRTLLINVASDNYFDIPKKNGGGGTLLGCGVIPYY